MDILQILKIIGLVGTIATGLISFVKPDAVYGFTGLKANGARGISEIRAVLGGLFIALGAAPFILGSLAAYQVVGITYLGVAIARAISIVMDKSYAQSNWISLGVEIIFGVILILP
jgi:hypothetical protein